MPTIKTDLQNIAALAHLSLNDASSHRLAEEVATIMTFVEQLRQVDTRGIEPNFHPEEHHQRLRQDAAVLENNLAALEAIAPPFSDGLYLVPKVIESGK